MRYLILLCLFLIGCEMPKERCSEHVFEVTATGNCMFNRDGNGTCAVLLDNERKTNFNHPAVVGQKVIECRVGNGESYFKTVNGK